MNKEITFLLGFFFGFASCALMTILILVGDDNRCTSVTEKEGKILFESNYNRIGDSLIINGEISIKDENGWHLLD
jgi:hypothetical protein